MVITVRVDFQEWRDLSKMFADAADDWPVALSGMVGEVGEMAKAEVLKVYRYEPYDDIGDERESMDSGKFGANLRPWRGGGKVRPWIAIGSLVPYATKVERGGTPVLEKPVMGRRGRRDATPDRRYYGQFADTIHEWAKRKFPGRSAKFADNVIAKIIREGIEGRRVIRRAISHENPKFIHFLNFTMQNRTDEFIEQFLAKKK